MKKAKILIVDDEEKILQTMQGSLEDEDYEVSTAKDGQEAIDKVRAENPDLIFLDIWLPGMDGMETLKAIKEHDANLDVVLMTGHGTMSTAIQAIKLGAFDFLEKPLSLDSILSVAHNALEQRRTPAPETAPVSREETLIAESPLMVNIKTKLQKLSKTTDNVLVTGERGTGKEFVARLIHNQSSRGKNPLIKFNCSLYSPDEMSYNLFGKQLKSSKKKAPRKIGTLEKAAKGTLFIDALEGMPLAIQTELFNTLKEKAKKADTKHAKSNGLRIIASAPENLPVLVKDGKFNEELYHFLGETTVDLPPLRERKGDIAALLTFFLESFAQTYNRKVKTVEEETLEALLNYNWPGNVKELKNITERLATSVPTTKISVNQLPPLIRGEAPTKRSRIYDKFTSLKEAENAWKREFLLFHLKKNNNDIQTTARKLGIRQNTLKKYITSFDIKLIPAKKPLTARQKTLKRSVVLSGQGLHSGMKAGLILSPLPPNSGIVFGNITTSENIPAHIDYVESTEYATTLRCGQATARTIEHFMAVLHAYHINNLQIKINGEIPIMDGSALDFCKLIEEAGIEEQDAEQEEIIIDEKYSVGEESPDSKFITIEPHDTLTIKYSLNYPEPVGMQEFTFTLKNSAAFKNLIAPARTFGFLKDIKKLESMGLASGGRLHNFILIDDEKIVNTKLRFPDEFVRHKILDLIGDFYLLGRPIRGLVTANMTGHSENSILIKKIRDSLNLYW
jgi:two-component system nitrogen regulation response regulator NtrX